VTDTAKSNRTGSPIMVIRSCLLGAPPRSVIASAQPSRDNRLDRDHVVLPLTSSLNNRIPGAIDPLVDGRLTSIAFGEHRAQPVNLPRRPAPTT